MSRAALARACGLGALAVLCFAPATAASAKEARSFSAEFSLRASNGYLISVSGGRHQVTITVAEGDLRSNHVVETTYSASGTASPKGVEANFGTLGEISLRFVPSGRAITKRRPKLPKGSKAPRTVVRREGAFVGVMRFEGEANYTVVEATEVHGSVWNLRKRVLRHLQQRLRQGEASPPTRTFPADSECCYCAQCIGLRRGGDWSQ